MFGGEEDFFDDDDFLQDVFQLESTVTPKENVNIMHTSTASARCVSADKENAQEQRTKDGENDGRTLGNKVSPPILSNKHTNVDKFMDDNSFDFGDDFPIDALDSEERTSGQSTLLGTPPDSDFFTPQGSLAKDMKTDKTSNSLISNKSEVKNADFRSKILKTLNECKQTKASLPGTTVPHASTNDISVARAEKRKVPLDEADRNISPLVKKPNTNFTPQKTSLSQKRASPGMETPISEFSVNSIKEGKGTSQYPAFSTPVKPFPANIRTTRSPGGPLIQKRKFPGPAGILPELGSSTTNATMLNLQERESPIPAHQEVVCSQSSASDFTCGPWQQMLEDMELDPTDHRCPLKVFNIKWVLRRSSLRGQAAVRKVPFLAVMLRNLDVTHADATALLKDKTGEMNATVASSVLEEYGPTLQTGSVILLRGVTVLSPVGVRTISREPSRKHYLNITLNTILSIYTPDDSGNVVRTLINEIDKNELYKEAAAPKSAACSRAIVEEEEEEIIETTSSDNKSLFSVNESFAQKSFPNQQQLPMYKTPRIGSNTSQNFSPRFQSKFNSNIPNNSIQMKESCQPRMLAPSNNRNFATSQRPSILVQSPSQNSQLSQNRPFSFRQSRPQAGTSAQGERRIESSNNLVHLKEAEEKELNDLLDDVDAESLFGDF